MRHGERRIWTSQTEIYLSMISDTGSMIIIMKARHMRRRNKDGDIASSCREVHWGRDETHLIV